MERDIDTVQNSIDYTEYERITDNLMWLSDNVSLNFTVSFSRKGKSGERIHYHSEYVYGSDKFGGDLRSIKRNMNYAFVIDVRTDFVAGMMLRPQDVELLSRLIDAKVLPWILMSTAFAVKDNQLILTQFEPIIYAQENKSLTFEPAIYVDDRSELESRGIKMTLLSGDSWILSADQFMGFYNILTKTDMYAVAAAMCNYVKTEPYGVNAFVNKGLGAQPVNPPSGNSNRSGFFNKNKFLDDANAKSKDE